MTVSSQSYNLIRVNNTQILSDLLRFKDVSVSHENKRHTSSSIQSLHVSTNDDRMSCLL